MSEAKVAVVTGASSGIGWCLAKELAREGYRVGLLARRGEALEKLASEIRGAGGVAEFEVADVIEREVTALFRHAGMIDDLELEIAELVLQRRHVAAADRIVHLIGFLDRVGRDGREILLEIPGAAGDGRAQGHHDGAQRCDLAGIEIGGIGHASVTV